MKLEDFDANSVDSYAKCVNCNKRAMYQCDECDQPNCDWCMSQFGCCRNKIKPKQEQKNVKT